MPNFSDDLRGSRPLLLELVEDRQHVARRHRDDVGLEIVDQLHLPLGHAAGDRHHRAAELFGAVMRAEAAGEQAIAIGVVHDHAGAAAGGADRARHHVRPDVDIGLGVADHDRLAGRAGRRVHAHQFFARHREHVEGIIVAQIGLHRERKFGEIGELLEIGGMHAGCIERLLVMRDVVVGMLERPGEPLRLQRHDLVARGALGLVQLGAVAASLGLERCRGHRAFPQIVIFVWCRSATGSQVPGDGAGMAAKLGDHDVADGDAHIVDAGTAAARNFARGRDQHVAELARPDEGDVALRRDRASRCGSCRQRRRRNRPA